MEQRQQGRIKRLSGVRDGFFPRPVRAAGMLGDDVIDNAETFQVFRRDLQRLRRLLRLGRVAPQDGGRALRRDHRIDGMLQHQHPVGGGDGDGPAGAALAGDQRHQRHAQRQAALRGAGDGLGLAALFRADARIGPGGVDEGQHRQLEALGHVHQAHRLAVAFRPRHAEVARDAALRVVALFLADDHDRPAIEAPDAAGHGQILGELAIARQRREFGDQTVDIVNAVRPLRMARHLRFLPGIELGIQAGQGLLGLLLQLRYLLFDGDSIFRLSPGGEGFQLGDLAFQLGDPVFEVEIDFHRVHASSRAGPDAQRLAPPWYCANVPLKVAARRGYVNLFICLTGRYLRASG